MQSPRVTRRQVASMSVWDALQGTFFERAHQAEGKSKAFHASFGLIARWKNWTLRCFFKSQRIRSFSATWDPWVGQVRYPTVPPRRSLPQHFGRRRTCHWLLHSLGRRVMRNERKGFHKIGVPTWNEVSGCHSLTFNANDVGGWPALYLLFSFLLNSDFLAPTIAILAHMDQPVIPFRVSNNGSWQSLWRTLNETWNWQFEICRKKFQGVDPLIPFDLVYHDVKITSILAWMEQYWICSYVSCQFEPLDCSFVAKSRWCHLTEMNLMKSFTSSKYTGTLARCDTRAIRVWCLRVDLAPIGSTVLGFGWHDDMRHSVMTLS